MSSTLTSRPRLLPISATDETFAGITYHLDGAIVPVLTVEITPKASVYFEHHVMFWKKTGVEIGLMPLKGMMKRMFAGMQIFITEATGQGAIAFSRDGAGQIFALHMNHGEEIHVREHQFLAASWALEYNFERVKGLGNLIFGGSGFFIDKFHARKQEGILWLHGYGNVFELELAPGEQIDVEPGGWIYKDASVKMDIKLQSLSSGLFGSMGRRFVLNRFTGPGRLGLQSMAIQPDSSGSDASQATSWGVVGGVIGGLLRGLAK